MRCTFATNVRTDLPAPITTVVALQIPGRSVYDPCGGAAGPPGVRPRRGASGRPRRQQGPQDFDR